MQDRLTYANGNTITTDGFRCSIGEPIDIKVTVGESEEVYIPGAASKIIPDGDYLITLEVNGEKAAYRDLYRLGEDTVTVGDYTISDDLYLTGVSEDDEVVIRLEPVELTVTDAFRAAVAKAIAQGGGSGGGVLVVTGTVSDDTMTLDKTWQEIHDADAVVIYAIINDLKQYYILDSVGTRVDSISGGTEYIVKAFYCVDSLLLSFVASSASDYPACTFE